MGIGIETTNVRVSIQETMIRAIYQQGKREERKQVCSEPLPSSLKTGVYQLEKLHSLLIAKDGIFLVWSPSSPLLPLLFWGRVPLLK